MINIAQLVAFLFITPTQIAYWMPDDNTVMMQTEHGVPSGPKN